MPPLKFTRILRNLFSLNLLLYAAAALLFFSVADVKEMREARVNYLETPLDDMAQLALTGRPGSTANLKEYALYFEMLDLHHPNRADFNAALGLCYYYLGDLHRAETHYAKAAELEPAYFWFQHNLAVIAFEQQEYGKATEYARKAQPLNANFHAAFTTASPFFKRLEWIGLGKSEEPNSRSDLNQGRLNRRRLGWRQLEKIRRAAKPEGGPTVQIPKGSKNHYVFQHYLL